MSQRQVTMRDVARAAGVHPGTVSRVLNPRTRPLVNPATADRVEQVAREMGYSLNPIARGLKTRRTFSVGVLIPDLTNPLFPPIIRGIERVLDAAGYTALVASTDGDAGPRAAAARDADRPPGGRLRDRHRRAPPPGGRRRDRRRTWRSCS